MDIVAKKTQFNNHLLNQSVNLLLEKLNKSQWFIARIIDANLNTETAYYVPMARRGNKPYAWRQYHRLEEIQSHIDKSVRIENNYSNMCLITLTLDPTDLSQKESWEKMKYERPKFSAFITRKLKAVHHATKIEAHANGYAHCHILMILPKMKKCFNDRNGKFRNIEITNLVKQKWLHGNSDVLFANDKNLSYYITKEMGKYAQVENSIQRYKKGTHTKNDTKAILTHYYADMCKMRLLCVSQSLKKGDVDIEEEGGACLDYYKTNSTKVIKYYFIPRQELAKILGYKPPPFTNLKPSEEDSKKLLNYIKSQENRGESLFSQKNELA